MLTLTVFPGIEGRVMAWAAVIAVTLSAIMTRNICGRPVAVSLNIRSAGKRLNDRVVHRLWAYGPSSPKPLIET